VRIRFIKHGKRAVCADGTSDYFEVSVECGQTEDPDECARRAKEFVRWHLADNHKPLAATLGERTASQKT
jgi:hypothetical protein